MIQKKKMLQYKYDFDADGGSLKVLTFNVGLASKWGRV